MLSDVTKIVLRADIFSLYDTVYWYAVKKFMHKEIITVVILFDMLILQVVCRLLLYGVTLSL